MLRERQLRADVDLPGGQVQRQDDPEGGAFAGAAVHADGAAEQGGELLADGQAQAGAAVGAGDGAVELAELLEDDGVLGRVDARALVGTTRMRTWPPGLAGAASVAGASGRRRAVQVGGRRVSVDRAAFGGELDRVGKQVVQHLLELARVAVQDRHVGRHRRLDRSRLSAPPAA